MAQKCAAAFFLYCALRTDIQLDAGANFGLNRHSTDRELYVGASVRF